MNSLKNFYIPKIVYLETINYCNANCIMCPNKVMKRKKGIMSWKLFKRIVDECKELDDDFIFYLHKDGEPLLDPLLFKRINYIRKKLPNSKISFYSNAALLNESMSKRLLESEIDMVTFSVDSTSKESYELIRRGLNYDVVKNNLDKFFRLKEESKSKIKVIMQMVVCDKNKSEIQEYKKLWSKKADLVQFKSMHNFLIMGTSIKTKELKSNQMNICKQPFDNLMVYWNGDLGLCCWDYDNLVKLGNITNEKIINVFNNRKYKKIRESMLKKDCREIFPCNICSQIYGDDMNMRYFN